MHCTCETEVQIALIDDRLLGFVKFKTQIQPYHLQHCRHAPENYTQARAYIHIDSQISSTATRESVESQWSKQEKKFQKLLMQVRPCSSRKTAEYLRQSQSHPSEVLLQFLVVTSLYQATSIRKHKIDRHWSKICTNLTSHSCETHSDIAIISVEIYRKKAEVGISQWTLSLSLESLCICIASKAGFRRITYGGDECQTLSYFAA